MLPRPCIYAGDFNCQHADWGYVANSVHGGCLAGSASLAILYNPQNFSSFYSGRWNSGTNPNFAFASVDSDSSLPDRRVLWKFPRPQHRPLLITPPRFALPVPSMHVKRRNFHKAECSHYIALANKFAKTLLSPNSLDVDQVYQYFCNVIRSVAKRPILLGFRNNYVPC